MISITDVVTNIVKTSPFLEEALTRDILSYSALARELIPKIEKTLDKSVTRGAVVMALKRISVKRKLAKKRVQEVHLLSNLTIRANLTEFTFVNSYTMAQNQKKLFSSIGKKGDVFINMAQGIHETTFIASNDIVADIEIIFQKETLLSKTSQLSSITIRFPKEYLKTPGVYYTIMKLLAWEGINVVEAVSTYLELTLVLENKDIEKTFSIISNYQK
ncbi:MAG: aspartate kinase [Candidatus Levybacteria bacterium]|nr:aspartate kinase [Candidatus Daviesbacteria bacterium]MBI4078835.1 aspartate kinase [Candidatus Levybacteria bacterium]